MVSSAQNKFVRLGHDYVYLQCHDYDYNNNKGYFVVPGVKEKSASSNSVDCDPLHLMLAWFGLKLLSWRSKTHPKASDTCE